MRVFDAHDGDVPVREVDVSKGFRWLVRVTVFVPVARVASVVDLCAQLKWGIRPGEGAPHGQAGAVRVVLVDVPMTGAKRGVFGAAARRAQRNLGQTGAVVDRGPATLVRAEYLPRNDYPYYKGFAGQQAGARLTWWRWIWIWTGLRDAGSIPGRPGEKLSIDGRVPEGHFVRAHGRTLRPDPKGGPPVAPAAPWFTKQWVVRLFGGVITVGGVTVLVLMSHSFGLTREQAWPRALLLWCVLAGCYQFARDRAVLAVILAAVPIGIAVLPQYTQMIAQTRIDAYLNEFGLSSTYLSFAPGATLEATARPIGISMVVFAIFVAIFGWVHYFTHERYWFEWIYLLLIFVTYVLVAVLTAGQAGQDEGVRAVAAARFHGEVPDIYGYSPSAACVTPLTANVAYTGASLPTEWATLVFGSSEGQTAIWDPRTGETTLVSTDDVRIVPVSSLRQSCSR